MTSTDELLSMEVALMESVSKHVQYRARPNTSRTMWNGRVSPVTTADESVSADVVE